MYSIRILIVSALFFTSAHTVCAMQSSEEKKTHNDYFPCSHGISRGPGSELALKITPQQRATQHGYLHSLGCILTKAHAQRDKNQGVTFALIAS